MAACGGDDEEEALVPTYDGEVPSDYTSYTKATTDRVMSQHMNLYVDIYVNSTGMSVWSAGTGTFPVGTVIVKEMFAEEADTDPVGWTTFEKLDSGYDPDFNDWHVQKIVGDSVDLNSPGSGTSCAGCHDDAAADKDMILFER